MAREALGAPREASTIWSAICSTLLATLSKTPRQVVAEFELDLAGVRRELGEASLEPPERPRLEADSQPRGTPWGSAW